MSTSDKIGAALEAFEATTCIQAHYEKKDKGALYEIALKTKQGHIQLLAEEISRVTKQSSGAIAHHLHAISPSCVLITHYINPNLAEDLKSRNVFFMDTCGNAYLNHKGIYLYIKGNKPQKRYDASQKHSFSIASLKLIFLFLCKPETLNITYRQMAELANIALGSVGSTIKALEDKHYLLDKGKFGRNIINADKLIQYWAAAYADRLRPKLLIEKYKSSVANWWKRKQSSSAELYFGGEVAAEHLTRYLKPEKITLYVKGNINKTIVQNKLLKDPDGDVEVLTKFWNFDINSNPYVPDLLVYADLLSTGDPRNNEVAGLIYESILSRNF